MFEHDHERYRRELNIFLNEFAWLHSGVNTRAISEGLFSHFPSDWRDWISALPADDLNLLATGIVRDSAPESLRCFVTRANRLNLFKSPHFVKSTEIREFRVEDCPPWRKGLKPKKAHEVGQVLRFFSENFNPEEIIVFDVGAGKDYVGEALTSLGFEVVSIEFDPSKRPCATQKHPLMTYIEFRLLNNEDSISRFLWMVKTFAEDKSKKACLLTLHGCGDLSPTVVEAYCRLPDELRGGLLVLSCCYHRCSVVQPSLEKISPGTEVTLHQPAVDAFFVPPCTISSLRLAAQDSPSNWLRRNWTQDDHVAHAKRFVYRALLEFLAQRDCESFVRSSVIGKSESLCYEDFAGYFETFSKKHEAAGKDGVRTQLPSGWLVDGEKYLKDNRDIFAVVEGFIALQYCIQPVLESSILFERLRFVQANVGSACKSYLLKLFDEGISPRCWGIVSLPDG